MPYEFHLAESLPKIDLIDMQRPVNFSRTYPHVPVGTWSDDGAQALCLLASLLHRQQLNAEDLMNRICNWYQHGYMAVDSQIFDVGIQTVEAIQHYLSGIHLDQVAKSDEYSNGNGALMRVLPLALFHQGTNDQLIEDAYAQSHITHAHLRSKLCCAIYCLWARNVMKGQSINNGWNSAIQFIYDYSESQPEALNELLNHIQPEKMEGLKGSGYVVDCLKSAYLANQVENYEQTIKKAISLGNDTDTTACVAGGISGIYYGVSGIPDRWMKQLRGCETVEQLLTIWKK